MDVVEAMQMKSVNGKEEAMKDLSYNARFEKYIWRRNSCDNANEALGRKGKNVYVVEGM